MLSALPDRRNAPACATRRRPRPSREIDNVAAFARLYGVVRFFYPSDAAAELDWNRFAVHGVSRVRAARRRGRARGHPASSSSPLSGRASRSAPPLSPAPAPRRPRRAARGLALPRPRVQHGGRRLPGQAHPPGASRADGRLRHADADGAGRGPAREGDPPAGAGAGHAPATPRAARPCGCAWTGRTRSWASSTTWANRLVRDAEWRSYAIEGTVADDAEAVAFGVMAVGGVTADFDAVELAVKDATGDWTPVPIRDPGFEAAAGDERGAWFRTGTSNGRGVTAGRRRARRAASTSASCLRRRGSRRRGALPGRRPDPRGARRPRPRAGPAGPRAARSDGRPGSARTRPARRARRAAHAALAAVGRLRARRPTSTSGWPTWSSPGACSATSTPTGPRPASTGTRRLAPQLEAARAAEHPRGPARRAQGAGRRRARRPRVRGRHPGQGGARGAAGGARRRRGPAGRHVERACRPRCRSGAVVVTLDGVAGRGPSRAGDESGLRLPPVASGDGDVAAHERSEGRDREAGDRHAARGRERSRSRTARRRLRRSGPSRWRSSSPACGTWT